MSTLLSCVCMILFEKKNTFLYNVILEIVVIILIIEKKKLKSKA